VISGVLLSLGMLNDRQKNLSAPLVGGKKWNRGFVQLCLGFVGIRPELHGISDNYTTAMNATNSFLPETSR
jgi:hypothetical protein